MSREGCGNMASNVSTRDVKPVVKGYAFILDELEFDW